jgi:hypothetical protein
VGGKISAYINSFETVARAYPVLCAILLILLVAFTAVSVAAIHTQRPRLALWSAAAIVITVFVFSWGDDTYTHVYRIAALSEELRHGNFSLMLINSTTGLALPTFTFYSLLPYVLPVTLDLLGLSAMIAFKILGGVQCIVLVLGLQRMVERCRADSVGLLCAVMLLCANYVYGMWTTRAAFAELWVYALIPWVIGFTLSASPAKGLILVFFLQACAHPIVLLQSLICEVPVALGLTAMGPIGLARRWFAPFTIAVVLAIPFWLPQALWQPNILGPGALPSVFADSFGTITTLFNPRGNRNIGIWMPISIVAMIVLARARLSPRCWFLVGAFVLLMALQTTYLYDVTVLIPTLQLSLFVWRLMIAAAFVGFAALVAGWPDSGPRRTLGLGLLASLAVIFMTVRSLMFAEYYIPNLAAAKDDRGAVRAFDSNDEDQIWGIREYLPNYANLPRNCPPAADAGKALFTELRGGVRAERAYITVHGGPIGYLDYTSDGKVIAPAACGEDLVLGPLSAGAMVRVSETKIDWLLYVRLLELAVTAIVLALVAARPRLLEK